MTIQFVDDKILFVGGAIAMDPACCCGDKCLFTWSVRYDCDTETWGEVTQESADCQVPATCEENGLNEWAFESSGEGYCDYAYTTCGPALCEIDDDCTPWPTAPAAPTGVPEDCDCPECPADCSECGDYSATVSGITPDSEACTLGPFSPWCSDMNTATPVDFTVSGSCTWSCTNYPLYDATIACINGDWIITLNTCGDGGPTMIFTKSGGGCPAGTYTRTGGTSSCLGGTIILS